MGVDSGPSSGRSGAPTGRNPGDTVGGGVGFQGGLVAGWFVADRHRPAGSRGTKRLVRMVGRDRRTAQADVTLDRSDRYRAGAFAGRSPTGVHTVRQLRDWRPVRAPSHRRSPAGGRTEKAN